MIVTYRPADGDEQTWTYEPRRMLCAERELAEKESGRDWSAFTVGVLQGNSRCRRVLLWLLQRRDHRSIRLADVEFAWDELEIGFTVQELDVMESKAAETLSGEQLEQALATYARLRVDAPDVPASAGKAPIAD